MNTTVTQHPFRPDYSFPPGETLRDRLNELNVSQTEFAARAGMSVKHANQIILGAAPITLSTAIILERITGIPASFWNRREADYREHRLRTSPRNLTDEDEQWLRSLPIKELQKRSRIPVEKDRARLYDAVLAFFGVADRDAFQRIWRGPVASFRRSQTFASHPGSVVAWLRIAQLDSQSHAPEPYAASGFRKALREVRSLTAHGDPNDLVDICTNVGVIVVFVPEVKGCRISGATWWANPSRPVIALSDRYKKDDYFWFTFFHEAAHILLHSKKETFVDDGSDNDMLEEEANKFARNFLIPPENAAHLRLLRTDRDIVAFADTIGIAPGIVVGRLQHDGLLDYNRGHALKRSLFIVED
jgi:HTH-type transcriptional regulator/antitoxin HigA